MSIATFHHDEPVHLVVTLPALPGYDARTVTITAKQIENAWNNTSHFPERRARIELGALSARLNGFEQYVQALAAEEGCAGDFDAVAQAARFAQKHIQLTRTFWHREAATASPMITGPARFPTERNRKRMASSDRARDLITEHEQRARKACERRAFPHGRTDGPIRSDAPDALKRLQEAHATAKGAERRRLADRIKDMQSLPTETRERVFGHVRAIENIEAMRMQLVFPGKPDETTRKLLRSSGFIWAPSQSAWQRLLNGHAYAARNRVLRELGLASQETKPAPPAGMYRLYGRLFQITAEFTDDDATNAHLTAHPGEGVLAVDGSRIICASLADMGAPA